jgi:cyclophilin family peptidyl-prolyl cis-trans isomerase
LLVGSGCVKSQEASSDVTFNYPDQQPAEQTAPVSPSDTTAPTSVPETTKPMTWTFPGKLADNKITNKQIRLSTEKGDIVFELFADTAPLTVSNFVYLTEGGYYNGLKFHRREEGFVIQGGDPSGNGTGGPGYKFADELADKYTYQRGIVAMANAGPATNGSQFFIMLADAPLPKAYSIFGRVTSGLDVVDKIKVGDKMTSVTVEDKK